MASVLDKKVIKDDKKFVYFIILIVLINVWFFSAPTKRMAYIEMFFNNIRYQQAKASHDSSYEEYMYHRNNAIYLIKLKNSRRTLHAIKEMDKAIATVPDYVTPSVVQNLYRDRGYIKLYAGDKKGALEDLLLSGDLNMNDNLKVAVILTDHQAYGMARKYCQNILQENNTAILGYVCLSYVYERAGKTNSARKIYDYAIENKKPSNPKLYVERALFKQRINDFKGFDEDIAIAKKLSPSINIKTSMIEEAVKPTDINLSVQ